MTRLSYFNLVNFIIRDKGPSWRDSAQNSHSGAVFSIQRDALHPALVEIVDDKVVAVLDCADHIGGPEPNLLCKNGQLEMIFC